MLIFGPWELIRSMEERGYRNIKVLNLSSFKEGFPRIDYINPFLVYRVTSVNFGYEFDCWYANYLLNNDNSYRQLLDILREVYNGNIVYIMIDPQFELINELIESLNKFLIERYGLYPNIIRDINDLDTLTETEFTTTGLMLLDREFENYLRRFGFKNLESDPEG